MIDKGPRDRAAELASELTRLHAMAEDRLLLRWRAAFGKDASTGIPVSLIRSILAWRLQADVLGDLDRASADLLDQIADRRASGTNDGPTGNKPGSSPGTLSDIGLPDTRSGRLQPGTVLVREHDGTIHHVMVLANGFSWNGRTFASLSKVAAAITGTNWNGRRFFGLKQQQARTPVGPRPNLAKPAYSRVPSEASTAPVASCLDHHAGEGPS